MKEAEALERGTSDASVAIDGVLHSVGFSQLPRLTSPVGTETCTALILRTQRWTKSKHSIDVEGEMSKALNPNWMVGEWGVGNFSPHCSRCVECQSMSSSKWRKAAHTPLTGRVPNEALCFLLSGIDVVR